VNNFRNESLGYCLTFTLLTAVALLFAGIWSLHAGPTASNLLVSTIDPSAWVISGLNLSGFLLGSLFRQRRPVLSAWILCLFVGGSFFSLISFHYDPHYILSFIVPIIFAILLLDWKQSTIFISIVFGVSAYLFYQHSQNEIFSFENLFPLLLLISISVLIEICVNRINANLNWFHDRYQIAIVNEQIIRDDEIKLKKMVDSLNEYEKYLSQTNNSLIIAREEAEQARAAKQSFVQNVSHELRTPLNMIIGFSETMVNSPESYGEVKWTPDLSGDIQVIYQNSQHLKSLIDDILDMASLENRRYEIELANVDLNAIIQEVVLFTQGAYHAKGLYLKTDLIAMDQLVRADAVRLKQVLINLLSNAQKYTRTGGVTISSKLDGRMAVVTVSDTGKGIPPEYLDKVFEAFFQVDRSNDREESGTGLGLFISKQLIELHGGRMYITSQPGKGTNVHFTIPLAVR
jgi:signal transduction histidine kinase